jgi:CRISPR/Cas system-associated exonuclease Cas4 (RecB family)
MVEQDTDYAGKATSFRMENVFVNGHTAHDKYQRWLWEMGLLWGKWRCQESECALGFFALSPRACERCGSVRLHYQEVPVEHKGLMIAGKGDGITVTPDGIARWLEVKTVGIATLRFDAPNLYRRYEEEQLTVDEVWFSIKRPFASHQRQGQIYMTLAQTVYPQFDIEECTFIYEWKPTNEVKEFTVKYNPEYVAGIIDTASEVAAAVREHTPLDRPEWADREGKTCGSCLYRKTCWGEGRQASEPDPVRVRRSTAARRRRVLRPTA